ncbi:MAG TPA: ABC transporter permease [Thermoplasmatales archaeon]|nr:ABC transporter permease [Thermoplasmatales archaeon]
MNARKIMIIAKKEFMDNVRNKWLIVITAILLLMTIASSIAAGGGEIGEMEATVTTLITLSSMFLPIIGIMLGYGTITGEVENGALSVVLSYPVKRIDVILGKFLGLSCVIFVSVLSGFGIAGLVISLATSATQWKGYLLFMLLAMLLGMLYVSLSLFFSAILKRRATSLGAGIFIFFWGMIIGTIWIGIYAATGGSIADLYTGKASFPEWFWYELFLSPQDGNQTATLLAFGIKKIMGISLDMPSWVNLGTIIFSQLLWTVTPLILAIIFFRRRDI